MDSHQPSSPAAQTSNKASVLKRKAVSEERGFKVSAAGGVAVGLEGGMKGVAGERWVASTFELDKYEWREDMEPRAVRSASAIRG